MRVAFVMDNVITCGGVIVPFEHCVELKKRGIDAAIYANGDNKDLSRFYNVEIRPIKKLEEFTDSDVIVSIWWMQMPFLEHFKGSKFQFIQGNDYLAYNESPELKENVYKTRANPIWKPLAVSKYAGEWTNLPNIPVIPNGVNQRFFKKKLVGKSFDVLVEGNDEPNKNIDMMIELAKEAGATSIAWLGRQTRHIDGVKMFENPDPNLIPGIYQQARAFVKLSHSEGFCLPILEAFASHVPVVTWPMGGNDFCHDKVNCFISNEYSLLLASLRAILRNEYPEALKKITTSAFETAQQFSWEKSTDALLAQISKTE